MTKFKSISNFLVKILATSTALVIVLNIATSYLWVSAVSEIQNNNKNYKNTKNAILSGPWVAITTNIWTRFKQNESLPVSIYKEVMSVSEIIWNKQTAKTDLISKNMLIIREYLNVLKIDVKSLIDNSYDKPSTLKVFLQQLKYRYELSVESQKNLIKQRDSLEKDMKISENKINNLKTKISSDFSAFNSEETLENIDNYLKLREEYTYARTYIIFINKFIKQYAFLNDYNKDLIDALINNRDAIVKDSYVVIPNSWAELLKKLDLLYEEDEFKEDNN